MENRNQVIKYTVATVLVVAVIVLVNQLNIFKAYETGDIVTLIQEQGAMGPIVYLGLLTLLPLLLFPDSVLVIAGGRVFGLFFGSVLTVIGSLLGGVLAFYIARKLGRTAVKKFVKRDLVIFDKRRSGFLLILMLRLIPLFPFKVVSYSAGLSDIKLKDFVMATTLGSLPGIIVYTNLGHKTADLRSTEFYIAIALAVGLFALSFAVKKVFEEKVKD